MLPLSTEVSKSLNSFWAAGLIVETLPSMSIDKRPSFILVSSCSVYRWRRLISSSCLSSCSLCSMISWIMEEKFEARTSTSSLVLIWMVLLRFPLAASSVLFTRDPRGRVILRAVHRDISIPEIIANKPIVSMTQRIWLICFSIGTSDNHTRMVPHRPSNPGGKRGRVMSIPGVSLE